MAYIYQRVDGLKFEEFIAYLPGVQDEVDDRAIEIAQRAEALLADHHVENVAHIELAKGDIDAYVVLVDTNVTNDETSKSNSALSIEFGRAGFIDDDGSVWGEMEGLHILTRAANLPKKSGPRAARRRLSKAAVFGRKRRR